MIDARAVPDHDSHSKVLRDVPSPAELPAATQPYAGAVSLRLAPDDGMLGELGGHYFECGASALNVILAALQLAQAPAPGSILDFGAGAGRVTRWLRAAFPDAAIGVCDLREKDMEFCRAEFGAESFTSGTDIEALKAPGTYDLIWVGSVLTHLSAEKTCQLTDKLLSWLNSGGLLVMSTIGRTARARSDSGTDRYIHPKAWEDIKIDYATLGFGYADYAGQAGYGLSLTKLSWLADLVERFPAARLILLSEGVWDGLHDIVAIQNSATSDPDEQPAISLPSEAALGVGPMEPLIVASLRARIAALESSTSWRLTKPLRAVMSLFRR